MYVKHLGKDKQDENTFLSNAPRYLKEHCLVWRFLAFTVCPSDNSGSKINNSRERLWNNNGRVKPKYSGRTLPQHHFVHHKFRMTDLYTILQFYTTEYKARDNYKNDSFTAV